MLQVIPITKVPDRPLRPYEALIEMEPSGLAKPSRAVANQIRTIARHRITKRLGRLSTSEYDAVDTALAIQLELRTEPSSSA